MGHDHIGHNCMGHDYMGHNCIGHNYIGHNYIGYTWWLIEWHRLKYILWPICTAHSIWHDQSITAWRVVWHTACSMSPGMHAADAQGPPAVSSFRSKEVE